MSRKQLDADESHFMDRVHGIFSTGQGDAIEDYKGVTTKVDRDGVHVNIKCGKCGDRHDIVLEYHELVALRYGISPHVCFQGASQWQYDKDEHSWYPAGLMTSCQEPQKILIGQNEGEMHLGAAQRRGFLTPQQYQQLCNHAAGAAQRMRGAGG